VLGGTQTVIVRKLKPADAADLQRTCFRSQALREVQDHVRWCLTEQEHHRLVCLVTEVNGQAVASAQLALLQGYGEIGSLVVAPALRRQGIGTALILALIEQARQRGVQTVEISADVDCHWIRAWYERLGFTYQREHEFPDEHVAVLAMDLTQGAIR
jgi:ribosomal protein S18 acetylase RimI-like enzyme